jgi:hypothetical protein
MTFNLLSTSPSGISKLIFPCVSDIHTNLISLSSLSCILFTVIIFMFFFVFWKRKISYAAGLGPQERNLNRKLKRGTAATAADLFSGWAKYDCSCYIKQLTLFLAVPPRAPITLVTPFPLFFFLSFSLL